MTVIFRTSFPTNKYPQWLLSPKHRPWLPLETARRQCNVDVMRAKFPRPLSSWLYFDGHPHIHFRPWNGTPRRASHLCSVLLGLERVLRRWFAWLIIMWLSREGTKGQLICIRRDGNWRSNTRIPLTLFAQFSSSRSFEYSCSMRWVAYFLPRRRSIAPAAATMNPKWIGATKGIIVTFHK